MDHAYALWCNSWFVNNGLCNSLGISGWILKCTIYVCMLQAQRFWYWHILCWQGLSAYDLPLTDFCMLWQQPVQGLSHIKALYINLMMPQPALVYMTVTHVRQDPIGIEQHCLCHNTFEQGSSMCVCIVCFVMTPVNRNKVCHSGGAGDQLLAEHAIEDRIVLPASHQALVWSTEECLLTTERASL